MEGRRFFGTNGIRFRPGVDYDLDFVVDMARAVGVYFRSSPILVGHDGRNSSPAIAKAACSGLMSMGVDVGEAGLLPTPALQYATKRLGYKGSVMITASHNPPEWNGIKVMGADGVEISREDEVEIESIFGERSYASIEPQGFGVSRIEDRVIKTYVNGVVSHVDLKAIRGRGFRVVLDLGNGAQATAAPSILERLGCKVAALNGDVNGGFPGRGAEPRPEVLSGLSEAVKDFEADLGVAYDGDGDRSIFCDERGVVHWGDRTGALLAEHVLAKKPSSLLVTPVSSSKVVDYVVEKTGSRIMKTRVGSVDVSRAMVKYEALFGVEENGGCFYAPHIPIRDGAMSTALMLEALTERGRPLSQLISTLPFFYQRKGKFECPDERKASVMEMVEKHVSGRVERIDGLKIWIDSSSWILLRPSGTEPLIRVFAESDDPEKLNFIMDQYCSILIKALKK